jgi:hypothetical protein
VILSIAGALVLLLFLVVSLVLLRDNGTDSTAGGSGAGSDSGEGSGSGDGAGSGDGSGSGEGSGSGSGSGSGTGSGSGSGSGSGAGAGDVTVGTGTYPDAEEVALLDLLPAEYSEPEICQRWFGKPDDALLAHDPLAAIFCWPAGGTEDTPAAVTFVRYGTDAEAEMIFSTAFPNRNGGDCVADQPMAGTYMQGDVDAGLYGCQINDPLGAYIAWTRKGRGVYAFAFDGDGRLDALYTWFLSSRAAIA